MIWISLSVWLLLCSQLWPDVPALFVATAGVVFSYAAPAWLFDRLIAEVRAELIPLATEEGRLRLGALGNAFAELFPNGPRPMALPGRTEAGTRLAFLEGKRNELVARIRNMVWATAVVQLSLLMACAGLCIYKTGEL